MCPITAETIDRDTWNRLVDRALPVEYVVAAGLYAPILTARAAGAPFVVGRIAQSLDGRIATPSGGSFWISGRADVLHTHRLRALCDAVVVGAGTVRADDPLLTTRACSGPSPVRVVLDPRRTLDPTHRVFGRDASTLLICGQGAGGPPRHGNAEVIALPSDAAGKLAPARIADALAARGLALLCVEGGGRTVSGFLGAGALDRLHVTIAPLLLGQGIPGFTLPAPTEPDDGMRFSWTVHAVGEDILLDVSIDRALPPMCRDPAPA